MNYGIQTLHGNGETYNAIAPLQFFQLFSLTSTFIPLLFQEQFEQAQDTFTRIQAIYPSQIVKSIELSVLQRRAESKSRDYARKNMFVSSPRKNMFVPSTEVNLGMSI